MLKKAGIVVAGSAAALFALSPLAFAGDWSGDHDKGHHHHSHSQSSDVDVNNVDQNSSHNSGLVALGNVNALNNVNVCPSIAAGLGVGDILGILSPGRTGDIESGDPVCLNDNGISQKND